MRPPFRLLTALLLLSTVLCFAQKPATDVRPALKSLTLEQKNLVLEYLRSIGSGIDDEIQDFYRKTPEQAQTKTVLLLEWLRQRQKQVQLATTAWEQDTLHFPDTAEGNLLTGNFRVTNTGTIPYVINRVTTTCDCATHNAPKHPLMPGESAVINFEFDTSGKLGTATPALIIYDNSTPNQRKILYAKANILARKKPYKYPWND